MLPTVQKLGSFSLKITACTKGGRVVMKATPSATGVDSVARFWIMRVWVRNFVSLRYFQFIHIICIHWFSNILVNAGTFYVAFKYMSRLTFLELLRLVTFKLHKENADISGRGEVINNLYIYIYIYDCLKRSNGERS